MPISKEAIKDLEMSINAVINVAIDENSVHVMLGLDSVNMLYVYYYTRAQVI
jgi:hypothetical protein